MNSYEMLYCWQVITISKKNNLIIFSRIGLFIATLLLVFSVLPNKASAGYESDWVNLWVGKVTPGDGHVGVDIWWPQDYLPCQHSSDIYYDACVLSNDAQTSYYKVQNYTSSSNDFPYGIFIDNRNIDTCTTAGWCHDAGGGDLINHGWARLITDASLEIYPHVSGSYNPSANTVGGVRVHVQGFPTFANGGRYSYPIGDIHLPQLGQSGVGKLNGFITNGGSSVSNNRVLFEVFQEQSTMSTTLGFPMTGFTTVRNNSDRYFNTGALPSGTYKIYITDTSTNHKIILKGVHIYSSYERIDFDISQPCFGHSGPDCTDPA